MLIILLFFCGLIGMEIVLPNRASTRNVDKVMPQCKICEVWFNVHSTYESGIYDIIKLQEIGIEIGKFKRRAWEHICSHITACMTHWGTKINIQMKGKCSNAWKACNTHCLHWKNHSPYFWWNLCLLNYFTWLSPGNVKMKISIPSWKLPVCLIFL